MMQTIRCCLIEDNQIIGESVTSYLEHHGYYVRWFKDGETFAETMDKYEYHIYIVDIMLPELDGLTIISAIRSYTNAPVMILTAKSSLDDKEEGFKHGADDYITKPFELKELLIRIQALLRRTQHHRRYHQGAIVIDFDTRTATKYEEEVHMSPKERAVFEYLAQFPGLVCKREDILETLWGESNAENSSRSLDVCIAGLRKKLDKELIQTVVNYGYKLKRPIA